MFNLFKKIKEYKEFNSALKEFKENSYAIISYLSEQLGERTIHSYENLTNAREYIKNELLKYNENVHEETYKIKGKVVSNIISEIPGTEQKKNIIILGAHYDTVEGSPGADDNASSIAALLEVHRKITSVVKNFPFKKTIRFVAFTLEEPPHIFTKHMGSFKYVLNCKKRKDKIELAVIMDMMGYGGKHIYQEVPTSDYRRYIPELANFLAVVTIPSCSQYAYLWKRTFNKYAKIPMHELIGPASIPGTNLSDHSSFLKKDYPAIMVTDTGFYRNENYHMPTDTIDTIQFDFLANNIYSMYHTLIEIANKPKGLGMPFIKK